MNMKEAYRYAEAFYKFADAVLSNAKNEDFSIEQYSVDIDNDHVNVKEFFFGAYVGLVAAHNEWTQEEFNLLDFTDMINKLTVEFYVDKAKKD